MASRLELIARRKKLGLTQGQLAEKASISRSYYTNIEKGRKEPSMNVAKCIADVLKTTIDKIFFEKGVPNRNSA